MLPDSNVIVGCPHCEGRATYMTLLSGNACGARGWTDGKQYAPMQSLPPVVVQCSHCPDCYWLADAQKIGNLKIWPAKNRQWPTDPRAEEPSEDGYYLALEKGLGRDLQQERQLCILGWWRRNDAFRDTRKAKAGRRGANKAQATGNPAMSVQCKKNLEALMGLLDAANENDCLMRVEVLRELGEFTSAIQVLGRVTSADHQAAVRQLRSLCDAGDSCVRELQFDA